MPATYTLTANQVRFREVVRLLKAEAGGKLLKAELYTEIKAILAPAVEEIKAGVLNWPTSGLTHGGPSLRQEVAAGIKVGVAGSGIRTGARVYARRKGPRGFSNAPRDVNREGWERGTRGGGVVTQIGVPGFFDRPIRARLGEFRAAVVAATERMAKRIGK